MGYVTRYHLSVVGVDGTDAKDERAVRKSRHPDYDAWVAWIEDFHDDEGGCPVSPNPGDDAAAFHISGNDYMEIPLAWLYDFWIKETDTCKWYRHEEDMKALSRHFPTLVFMLEGEGEEAKDLWIKYFKNGKMQACPAKITYDEYNPSKLVGLEWIQPNEKS